MILKLLETFGGIGQQIAKNLFPDPQDELKRQQVATQIQNALMTAQADIITTESKSESWLARNWRPITMLTFVALVVAKWLGWTAEGVTEAIEVELMKLIQMGLGGYVVGRSVEKGIKAWKEN